ncbi:MAG: DUF131 domain-containing protein [Thermoproteota archaeon]
MFALTVIMEIGFLMLVLGIFVLMLAILIDFLKVREKQGEDRTSVQGGAVVMIGPIPIILSTDPKSAKFLMLLAIVLMVVMFLFIIFLKFL